MKEEEEFGDEDEKQSDRGSRCCGGGVSACFARECQRGCEGHWEAMLGTPRWSLLVVVGRFVSNLRMTAGSGPPLRIPIRCSW